MILERGGRDVLTERIDISVSFAHVYIFFFLLKFCSRVYDLELICLFICN